MRTWTPATACVPSRRTPPAFDFRLPELYGGTQHGGAEPLIAYPAACRPQAWAAASAVAILQTVLGLRPDVPGKQLVVDPLQPAVAGAVSASGLRLGGEELTVRVTREGEVSATSLADVVVRTGSAICAGRSGRGTT